MPYALNAASMAADYFLYTDQQTGPYDVPALQGMMKQGQLTKDSFIFRQGETADWTRAEDVPSLKSLFQAAPLRSASGLASKLQQATEVSGDEGFGTMLVSPSAGAKVRSIQSALPSAPLSDLPAQTAAPAAAPAAAKAEVAEAPVESPKGFFQKLMGLFGRK